jgi:hypothetical protein
MTLYNFILEGIVLVAVAQLASFKLVSPEPPAGYTDKDKKVVKIYPDLHEALGNFVEKKGDSYDIIIRRLVNFYEEHQQQRA